MTNTIYNAKDASKILTPFYLDAEDEVLTMISMDGANHVKAVHVVASGCDDSVVFSTKQIARLAVLDYAKAIIIAHNHPSDNVKPSSADLKHTKQLKAALELFDIQLCDHVIFGADAKKFFSMADAK